MQVTITLREVSCGTELETIQEGVPSVIPAEACYLGWQESLLLLAHLVGGGDSRRTLALDRLRRWPSDCLSCGGERCDESRI